MLGLNNRRYLIPGVEFKNGTKWRREKMGKQSEITRVMGGLL